MQESTEIKKMPSIRSDTLSYCDDDVGENL